MNVHTIRRRAMALALVLVGRTALHAQSNSTPSAKAADSIRVAIEAGVDAGDLTAIEAAAALAERALAAYPDDAMLLHYRAYALYRAGTLVFGRDGSGKARPYFDRARDILEPLSKRPTIPETYGLLASVYGMQIASAKVSMLAGMRLGPKSNATLDRAVAAGPNNPRVWVMRGIGAFNTPSTFGGGLDKAESYLKKALDLAATDAPEPPLPAWGRADAHIWLGRVYAKQKHREEARAEFEKARELQPRNFWITQVLLPSLDRQP